MKYTIGNDEIEFFVSASFGKDKCISGIDAEIPLGISRQLIVDLPELAKGYVSLQSHNVNISANGFNIKNRKSFKEIGWSNIITKSFRSYIYDDGTSVVEWVDNLPTWDGDDTDRSPFYSASYFSSDASDRISLGSLSDLEDEDLIFNDAPCQPPSYGMWKSGCIDLGKFEMPSKAESGTTKMTAVSGQDEYILCLTVVDKSGNYHIPWWITWTVDYHAKVAQNSDKITVTLLDTAKTALNTSTIANPISILNAARKKQDSVSLKKYARRS